MRIGELARRSKIAASRIRFYETHGLLPKADRSENGYRDYPDGVVETLGLIHGAQDLGFSLSEIKAALAEAGANPPSKDAMLEALRIKLASLDRLIDEVTLRRRRIVDLMAKIEKKRERATRSNRVG